MGTSSAEHIMNLNLVVKCNGRTLKIIIYVLCIRRVFILNDFIIPDRIQYGWTRMTTGERRMTKIGGIIYYRQEGGDCMVRVPPF